MTHVDDGTLVRWLDGEIADAERTDTARHLATCEACEARLAAMRRRSDLVRFALRRADVTPRARPRRARWSVWAAAAAAVLVVTGITVKPVRAWVVQRVASAWSLVTGSSVRNTAPVASEAPQARSPHRGSVAFVPAGDVFVLHVANRQAVGRLAIHRSDDETAVAEIRGEDGGESVVVLPTGLRIVNAAASRADYELRLPSSVTQIFVTIGDEPATRLLPDRGTERWEVSLVQIPAER